MTVVIDRPTAAAHVLNLEAWERLAATWYAERLPAKLARLRDGIGTLDPVEASRLAAQGVGGKSVVHLQCADGSDTLDILRLGASRVIGIDFAPTMIQHARWLSSELGAQAAHWHVADVLHLPAALTDTADVVYTGMGSLMWLHDLGAWARNVRQLLQPGGRLVVFDYHPVSALPRHGAAALRPEGGGGLTDSDGRAVRGSAPLPSPRRTERVWPLHAVVQAVIDTGIVVSRLSEHSGRDGNGAAGRDRKGGDGSSDLADSPWADYPRTFLLEGRVPGG